MDSAQSRRNASHGIDYPPQKVTMEVTPPPPIHTFGAELVARPSTTFQQLYEAQSRELATLRHEHRVAVEEKRATEGAYAALMRQYEEKSWKLSTVHDEHRAVIEQQKKVEKDCAMLRQQCEAAALQQKRETERDGDLRRESGVQTYDHGASRHQRCVPLEQHRAVVDAHATLKQQYEQQYRELAALRRRHQRVENDFTVLSQQREEQSRSLDAVHRECQIALEQKEQLRKDHAILRREYEVQRDQNNALRENNRSLKAAFEQRTSELHGVERFLATADTHSGAEVVSTLRTLNAGMQQSITSMAEWMVDNLTFEVPRTDHLEIMEQTRMSELLGFKFLHLLEAKMCTDNPILLEMALQAYLTYELYQVASQRTIAQEDQLHVTFIDGIYQRMREAGESLDKRC